MTFMMIMGTTGRDIPGTGNIGVETQAETESGGRETGMMTGGITIIRGEIIKMITMTLIETGEIDTVDRTRTSAIDQTIGEMRGSTIAPEITRIVDVGIEEREHRMERGIMDTTTTIRSARRPVRPSLLALLVVNNGGSLTSIIANVKDNASASATGRDRDLPRRVRKKVKKGKYQMIPWSQDHLNHLVRELHQSRRPNRCHRQKRLQVEGVCPSHRATTQREAFHPSLH